MRKYKWVNDPFWRYGMQWERRRLLEKVLDKKGRWRGKWTNALRKVGRRMVPIVFIPISPTRRRKL